MQFYGIIGKDGTWIKDRMMNYGIDVSGIIISDVGCPCPLWHNKNSDDYNRNPLDVLLSKWRTRTVKMV